MFRMQSRTRLVVLLVVAAFVAECSSRSPLQLRRDAGAVVPSSPIAPADLCAPMREAICQYLITCQGVRYRDLGQCVEQRDCRGLSELISAVQSGTVGYDAQAAGQCYAAFMDDPCRLGLLWGTTVFNVLDLCPGTITPTLTAGEACMDTQECAGGLYCQKSETAVCPGICATYPCDANHLCGVGQYCAGGLCRQAAQAGDPCTEMGDCNWGSLNCDDGEICPGNVWCDLSAGQCRPGVLEGGACGTIIGSAGGTSHADCALNLWCDAATGLAPGVCQQRSAAGGPCISSGNCLSGLYCEGFFSGATVTFGTCVATAGPGAACVSSSQCQSGLVCRAGACGLGGEGDGCAQDDECAAGLFCHQATCAKANYPGSPCNDKDAFCAYSRCTGGVCSRFKLVGEACASADECASRSCPPSTGTCFDASVCAP